MFGYSNHIIGKIKYSILLLIYFFDLLYMIYYEFFILFGLDLVLLYKLIFKFYYFNIKDELNSISL